MPNYVEIECSKCNKKMLISRDELLIFEKGICNDCDTQTAKFIRHKIVYGYYELPEIKQQVIDRLIEKEFNVKIP